MAYTICDKYGEAQPLRFLLARGEAGDQISIGAQFQPCWWVCDPCNPSARRYEVTFASDRPAQFYPWYQVVLPEDDQREIDLKIEHYRKVIAAQRALEAARREFERLNG